MGAVLVVEGPTGRAAFEKNHMKTVGGDGWFVYFRLYAPLKRFFDKIFGLRDFEIVA